MFLFVVALLGGCPLVAAVRKALGLIVDARDGPVVGCDASVAVVPCDLVAASPAPEASPRAVIMEAVQEAMAEAFGEGYRACNPKVTPATRPDFGDYQVGPQQEGRDELVLAAARDRSVWRGSSRLRERVRDVRARS